MSWSRRGIQFTWLVVATLILTPASHCESPSSQSKQLRKFTGRIIDDNIRPHIQFLASPELKGRSGESALMAANYVRSCFKKTELQPLFDSESYFQPIPGSGNEKGKTHLLGRNVGAWIPGSDDRLKNEIIIISAHYDHLGVRDGRVYRGADDNASGVSMLLEVARQISAESTRPRRSIVFLAFDLEEQLLWGSRWFVAHPPWPLKRVKFFLTADMIGRSLGNLPLPVVFVLGSEHAPELKRVLDDVGHPHGLEVSRLGIDLIGTRSDYGPFRDKKIPFLFISTGEHPDYHTPQDLPDRIDYKKVARVASLVLRITNSIANADSTPLWTDKFEPDVDEARAIHQITTLLLKSDKKLTDLQQFIVSQTQIKTKQIVDRNTMTTNERKWLTRVSKLLLLSIF